MTWEEKAHALNCLRRIQILMRKPGDWYIHQDVEVKPKRDSGVLVSAYGNGETPQDAIEDHWRQLVDEVYETSGYLVLSAMDESKRRHVRWTGFMWEDIP